ncbi:response regulator [Acaryochloris sp. IP29b_bin.148]|uniref:hybrid sensor histidine kinase/response regulator n=1 Tax=Acaryochloris sp. IP29b_bin.148 TaxID=2969218 RepID=UPI0026088969|nr:response regulator [Acaryochloris sp. IP29b_bin.148]
MSKILVIEDQDDIRSIICEILAAEGFNVVEAEDGHIGVLLAQEELPDLVICDIMMPEFDGYSVMTQLRQNPYVQSVPFIFLTAKASKTDLRLGMELGANDYLTKPFTRDELLGAVNAQIEQRSTEPTDHTPLWNDTCCDLIQALPPAIHNPLQRIAEFAQILKNDIQSINSDYSSDLLDKIGESGELIYNLLQKSLIYNDLVDIEKDPQRLRILRKHAGESSTQSVIANIARSQSQHCNRIADLQLELEEASVQLAQPKLKKLVEEIVENAFNYSPVGTPVHLTSHCRGKTFLLNITNQGKGLSSQQIADLGSHMQFDHALYKGKYVGLGLIIAKLIAELHGGELQVESVPHRLTTISVFLPLS